jgi:hypothetical protein
MQLWLLFFHSGASVLLLLHLLTAQAVQLIQPRLHLSQGLTVSPAAALRASASVGVGAAAFRRLGLEGRVAGRVEGAGWCSSGDSDN